MQWKYLTMKKKEMIPLADKENKSYEKQKVCYICKKQKKGYLNLMSVSSKVMMEKVIRVIFLKWMSSIQKICLVFIVIYHFYLKERKSKNVISLFVTFMRRKTMLFT